MATAMSPGTRIVAKLAPPAPALRIPCPILGNTYANTKTESSGFITVRVTNGAKFRISTRVSRSMSPPKARAYCRLGSVTEGLAGQVDEDGLEGRLAHRDIPQRVRGGSLHHPRQQPLPRRGHDPEPALRRQHLADARDATQRFGQAFEGAVELEL